MTTARTFARGTRASHRSTAAANFERQVRADIAARRWLRVHVFFIGLATLASCWGLSSALLAVGVDKLALRHAAALLGSYVIYLGLMRLWARWMLSRDEGDGLDLLEPAVDVADAMRWSGPGRPPAPVFRSGGGGDFGGGGATGSWDHPVVGAEGGAAGDAVSGALSSIGDLDEGAVVAVPLIVIIGVAMLLATAFGFAVFGLFGIDILLGVAVEIAFASAGGAMALKARREGWLLHVVRRTALPMAAVLAATVLASLAIGHWLPQAETLPQALRMLMAAF